MGLLSGILGNTSKVDTAELQEELEPLLIDGEDVVTAFKVVRDLMVFTNLRVIFIDKQGITGRKVDYMTVPYGSIVKFSKEGRGVFRPGRRVEDLDPRPGGADRKKVQERRGRERGLPGTQPGRSDLDHPARRSANRRGPHSRGAGRC